MSKARELANLGNAYSDGALSNRNKIINGAMVIDQRNGGSAITTNDFVVDRFDVVNITDGAFSAQQDSSAPEGFQNSVKFTTTTADSSLSSTQFCCFVQSIEGYNMADFDFGISSAKTVTLSFWVRSSLTGTFGGVLKNNAGNRSHPYTYTINAADTWEYKTVIITGDTTGTWLKTNGRGAYLQWGLGVGSTYSGTAGAWGAANYISATGATSVISNLNATWYITGVQLEVGDTATPFEHRSYGDELLKCCRYYQRAVNMWGWAYNSSSAFFSWKPTVPFRASPSMGCTGVMKIDQPGVLNRTQSSTSFYTFSWDGNSGDHNMFHLSNFSSMNTNVMIYVRNDAGITTWDAEL